MKGLKLFLMIAIAIIMIVQSFGQDIHEAGKIEDKSTSDFNSRVNKRTGFIDSHRSNNLSYKGQDNATGLHSANKTTDGSAFVLTEQISETNIFGNQDLEKTTYTYDENANNTGQMLYRWENSDWSLFNRITIMYDEFNRETENIIEVMNNSEWGYNYKAVSTYDNNGNLSQKDAFYWNQSSNDWELTFRNTYTYDENNNLITDYSQWQQDSTLVDDHLGEYTYDENNFLVEYIGKFADGSGGWDDNEWELYTNDAMGNQIEILSKYWDVSGWVDNYNAFLTYNEYNNQTGTLGYSWDGSNWKNTTRITFTYDENQNNTMYLFETNYDGSGWTTFNEITSTYEVFVTDVETEMGVVPEKFSLSQNYPNPFNPSTKIKFSIPQESRVSLKLYDVTGKEVGTLVNEFMQTGSYTINFNANELSSGIYFYQLQTDGFVQTKKMTLLK